MRPFLERAARDLTSPSFQLFPDPRGTGGDALAIRPGKIDGLPLDAKVLLVAAFIAGENPENSDIAVFGPKGSGRRSKRQRTGS